MKKQDEVHATMKPLSQGHITKTLHVLNSATLSESAMTVAYRDARSDDAARVASFAAEKFIEAYRDKSPIEMLVGYAQHNFSEQNVRAEIDAHDTRFIVAHDEDELAAYAIVRYNSFPDCEIAASAPAELQRIYVDPRWQGTGVARELIGRCTAGARAAGSDVVWLSVWVENPRAIRFYLKSGFQIIGEQPFLIGDEVQRDFVMAWPAR